MWATLTSIVMLITVAITGYYAVIFLRNADRAMVTATHSAELLPQVMAGRYLVMFLLALGVLLANDVRMAAYFLAVSAILGLYDGWLYWSRGLPNFKHTMTGVLAVGGLSVAVVASLVRT